MNVIDLRNRTGAWVVCGDIHGEFAALVAKIEQLQIHDATVIVAGDCGFGFYNQGYYDTLYQRKMHDKLSKANVLLLKVRGNHDDPSYFEKRQIDSPFMKGVADYMVVQSPQGNILCVGGATSIDRVLRINKMELNQILRKDACPLYWEDELFIFDEERLLGAEELSIDCVVTHTAPSFAEPFSKKGMETFIEMDDVLAQDLDKERAEVDKLFHWLKANKHPITNWYYGHFHRSAQGQHDGCTFHLLDIMELKEML